MADIQAAADKLIKQLNPHDADVGIAKDHVDGKPDEIVVYVKRSRSMMRRFTHQLPKEIDGFPVRVVYTGQIKPAS